jgi:predicted RND superfamily exporter protein
MYYSEFDSRQVHPGKVKIQRAKVKIGPIAQLVERFYGIEEVRGSNPLGSTNRGRNKMNRENDKIRLENERQEAKDLLYKTREKIDESDPEVLKRYKYLERDIRANSKFSFFFSADTMLDLLEYSSNSGIQKQFQRSPRTISLKSIKTVIYYYGLSGDKPMSLDRTAETVGIKRPPVFFRETLVRIAMLLKERTPISPTGDNPWGSRGNRFL